MNALNAVLGRVFDLLLNPVAGAPAAAIVAMSVVAGFGMTIVFRYTSPQRVLRRVADRTRAMMLGMRLFRDDLRVAIRYQAALLAATGLRLLCSLPPMLVLAVPFLLVLAQLATRFEHRPLAPGDAAVLEAQIRPADWPAWRHPAIEVPPGIRVETPVLRDETRRALYWRLRAEEETAGSVRIGVGSTWVEKTILATRDPASLCAVSARRVGRRIWDRLLHPGEPAFDDHTPVEWVAVHYPERSTPILGLGIPWWGTFLIVSMLTALLVRPVLRVQF